MAARSWTQVIIASAAFSAGLGIAACACAQSFPRKPITFVVPYGPGAGNDVIARILQKKVTENWGQNVVVVNRPGATGAIALELTAAAPADGHTIIIGSSSQIVNQHLSKVRYDFVRDFVPATHSGTSAYAVSVLKSFPVNSLKDLIAPAKAHPGKMNYTGTIGSIAHFMGWQIKNDAKVDIVMIPNKLAAEAEADVLAGRIEIWIATVSTSMRQVRSGKIKVLAVSGDKRSVELPNVPTVTELGYPRANLVANYYIMAPIATPKPIVDVLNAEFVKALGDKEVRERLLAAGVEASSSTPQEAASLLRNEVARWEKIVRESGIRIE